MGSLSRRDNVTGLDNRRQFVIAFENSVKKSIQKNRKISLLMIELSGLKHIDNLHGKDAANLVVTTFASLLSKCIDFTDQVFCYGDDQFTVIINHTENTSINHVVEDICHVLDGNGIMKEFDIDYSIGQSDLRKGDDFNGLVARTEKSLNCVKSRQLEMQTSNAYPHYDLVANCN